MTNENDPTDKAVVKRKVVSALLAKFEGRPLPATGKSVIERVAESEKVASVVHRIATPTPAPTPTPTVSVTTQPPVASAGEKTETWREREARSKREEQARSVERARLLEDLTAELAMLADYNPSGCNQFRADGRSPWQLLEDHESRFAPYQPVHDADATLRWFFQDSNGKSPEEMTQLWISGKPSGMSAVSTGPNMDDNQGASNAQWYYAITLSDSDVDWSALGFPVNASGTHVGNAVRLLRGGGNLVVTGGKLGECIWVGGVPTSCIKAYKRAGGQPWEQTWRPFTPGDIAAHKDVLAQTKYEPLFSWASIYRTTR